MARKTEHIVEEQVRTWTHREALSDRSQGPAKPWPIITISREPGAGGDALAQELGRRTGFTVWDKTLLQAVAEESGAEERLMASLDGHRRRAIEDMVRGALTGRTNVLYLRALMRVVSAIATHGHSIIVGRGAHYICAPAECLRVRVVAPLEQRVRNYAIQHGMDERAARRQVESIDADQADFVRHQLRHELSNPADYDLVLNAGVYRTDALVEMVLLAYEHKLGRRPAEVIAT